MFEKLYTNPLDGLTADELSKLSRLSTQALEVDAKRLAAYAERTQAMETAAFDERAFAAVDQSLDVSDANIDAEVRDFPRVEAPLAHIRHLAKLEGTDPKAAKLVHQVRRELGIPLPSPTRQPLVQVGPERSKEVPAQQQARTPLPNQVEGEGIASFVTGKANPTAVPEDVSNRYTVRGKQYHNRSNDQVAFVDHGARLETGKSFDGYAIKSMVAIAESRGWDSIKVSGDPAFRRAVWFEAASRGMKVNGYEPSEDEKKSVRAAAERSGSLNRIEQNANVKAFLDAKSSPDRSNAAKSHPELRGAFALEAALKRFAEQRLPADQREAFMDHQRQHIAGDLANGRDFKVMVRQTRQLHRERDREAEQSR